MYRLTTSTVEDRLRAGRPSSSSYRRIAEYGTLTRPVSQREILLALTAPGREPPAELEERLARLERAVSRNSGEFGDAAVGR